MKINISTTLRMEKRKDEEARYPPKLLSAKRLHVHNQHLQ